MSFVTCDLGIVVVTYNSEHVVSGLLDSLTAGLAGVEADVIVVDNDSIDGTVTLLECRDNVVVLRSENHGYAAGINRGVAELPDAKAILVLNPDVRLAPGAVPALLESLQLPNTGIVAPRVVDGHGALHRSMRREPTLGRALGLGRTGIPWLSEYVSEADAYAQPQVADWALGAALLISRHCFDALGGWDESFFLYSEETDFCLRARDMGLLTRYTPAAEVMHIGGQSGQSSYTHAMQIVNRVRLFRRRHNAIASFSYFLLAVASELSWVVRGNHRSIEAIRALLNPSRRAAVLKSSNSFIPI
jgi:Predicted glycosyltransferases